MNETKEFLGKTLDAAIAEACKYYDASRDQLEIEIIEDAKSGIFGLVGARKAKIIAKRVEIPAFLPSRKSENLKPETKPETRKPLKPKTDAQPESENQVRQEKPKEDKPTKEDKAARGKNIYPGK